MFRASREDNHGEIRTATLPSRRLHTTLYAVAPGTPTHVTRTTLLLDSRTRRLVTAPTWSEAGVQRTERDDGEWGHPDAAPAGRGRSTAQETGLLLSPVVAVVVTGLPSLLPTKAETPMM